MSESHFDEYEHYNYDQDKAMFSGHSGKQRSKKEAEQNTNRYEVMAVANVANCFLPSHPDIQMKMAISVVIIIILIETQAQPRRPRAKNRAEAAERGGQAEGRQRGSQRDRQQLHS